MSKKRVVVDVTIECDAPTHMGYYRDMEARARAIERWAKGFEEFVRDHRSQDPVSLTVIRSYGEVCSYCLNTWEEDDEGPLCCAKAQEEHIASSVSAVIK